MVQSPWPFLSLPPEESDDKSATPSPTHRTSKHTMTVQKQQRRGR